MSNGVTPWTWEEIHTLLGKGPAGLGLTWYSESGVYRVKEKLILLLEVKPSQRSHCWLTRQEASSPRFRARPSYSGVREDPAPLPQPAPDGRKDHRSCQATEAGLGGETGTRLGRLLAAAMQALSMVLKGLLGPELLQGSEVDMQCLTFPGEAHRGQAPDSSTLQSTWSFQGTEPATTLHGLSPPPGLAHTPGDHTS